MNDWEDGRWADSKSTMTMTIEALDLFSRSERIMQEEERWEIVTHIDIDTEQVSANGRCQRGVQDAQQPGHRDVDNGRDTCRWR